MLFVLIIQFRCQSQASLHHLQFHNDATGLIVGFTSWLFHSGFGQYCHCFSVSVFEQKIQDMEERRIERVGDSMKTFAELDRQILPIVGKCLDGITKAAESIEAKAVSHAESNTHARTHKYKHFDIHDLEVSITYIHTTAYTKEHHI